MLIKFYIYILTILVLSPVFASMDNNLQIKNDISGHWSGLVRSNDPILKNLNIHISFNYDYDISSIATKARLIPEKFSISGLNNSFIQEFRYNEKLDETSQEIYHELDMVISGDLANKKVLLNLKGRAYNDKKAKKSVLMGKVALSTKPVKIGRAHV